MKISATSHPEKQEKVYEFWLGFFEKITVLLFAVVIIPRVVGQLNYETFVKSRYSKLDLTKSGHRATKNFALATAAIMLAVRRRKNERKKAPVA